jgi:hypothetical protein
MVLIHFLAVQTDFLPFITSIRESIPKFWIITKSKINGAGTESMSTVASLKGFLLL